MIDIGKDVVSDTGDLIFPIVQAVLSGGLLLGLYFCRRRIEEHAVCIRYAFDEDLDFLIVKVGLVRPGIAMRDDGPVILSACVLVLKPGALNLAILQALCERRVQ